MRSVMASLVRAIGFHGDLLLDGGPARSLPRPIARARPGGADVGIGVAGGDLNIAERHARRRGQLYEGMPQRVGGDVLDDCGPSGHSPNDAGGAVAVEALSERDSRTGPPRRSPAARSATALPYERNEDF